MTRACFDAPVHALAPVLIALAASGCVVHGAGDGATYPQHRPQGPSYGQPPTGPYQPPSARCALDAPELVVVRRGPVQQGSAPSRDLIILESGAWVWSGDRGERTGCLRPGQMHTLRREMARADFAPPPPPAFQCQATPVEAVVIQDHAHHRQARYTTPCGTPVHDSIRALERMLQGWIRAELGQPAPPPAPPSAPACSARGTPIYRETHWSGTGSSHDFEIIVYPSGAWHHTAGGHTRRGCLPPAQRAAIERHIRGARMQVQAVTGPRCMAVPSHRHRIVTPRGTALWNSPCGARTPHPTLLALQRLVRRATGA